MPNESKITVFSINKMAENSAFEFMPLYLSISEGLSRTIDLTKLISKSVSGSDQDQIIHTVSMKATSPLHALHSYPDDRLGEENIMKRSNQLSTLFIQGFKDTRFFGLYVFLFQSHDYLSIYTFVLMRGIEYLDTGPEL